MTTGIDRAAMEAAAVTERLAMLADDTGIAAVELRELWLTETAGRLELAEYAVASGDRSEVARLAHGAAGTTGICGAAALSGDFTHIERLAAAGRLDDARQALAAARVEFCRLTSALPGGPPP